ncbi:MAG: poly(3-hydroxyalkanoate) granule-associated protein PhaF [Pseudomonadaceae bacterium]|nr:MAG: poly(3-hydroxyalkanoate) granule-associated protein PhaF [Pseudomonadaceae bacterium]
MAGKKKADKTATGSGWVSEIENYSRQIWLAGLGAYAKAGKEGVKLFEGLIKDGEVAEKAAKTEIDKQVDTLKGKRKSGKATLDDAKSKADQAKGKLTGKWNELESAFEQRLNSAVSRLGVPTRGEIQQLDSKIDELTKQISALAANKPAAAKAAPKATPAATARRKPAAKTAAAKSATAASKPATPAKPKAPAKPRATTAKPKAPAKPKATPAATKPATPAAAKPTDS